MNALQTFIRANPYLTDKTMPELVKLDRLCPVLVRCGGCRFTCGAQDAAVIIAAMEKSGDYVRDVSFPVGAFDNAARWQASGWGSYGPGLKLNPDAKLDPAQPLNKSAHDFTRSRSEWPPTREAFECGGTFDGFSCGSDADSGL